MPLDALQDSENQRPVWAKSKETTRWDNYNYPTKVSHVCRLLWSAQCSLNVVRAISILGQPDATWRNLSDHFGLLVLNVTSVN